MRAVQGDIQSAYNLNRMTNNQAEDKILDLIDNRDNFTRSDLQGIVSALVRTITKQQPTKYLIDEQTGTVYWKESNQVYGAIIDTNNIFNIEETKYLIDNWDEDTGKRLQNLISLL